MAFKNKPQIKKVNASDANNVNLHNLAGLGAILQAGWVLSAMQGAINQIRGSLQTALKDKE